ncbi:hypothetical protein WI95_10050 [Burkholderia contaminans]|nr:hypothetical protein WI95_10050 [Burkholderia contaminans]
MTAHCRKRVLFHCIDSCREAGGASVVLLAAPSPLACGVLQHSCDVSERIAKCGVHVLVVLLAGHQFMSGSYDPDPDIERFSLLVVFLVELDFDPATRDVLPDSVELGYMPRHRCLECIRVRHALKDQFKRWLHRLIRR